MKLSELINIAGLGGMSGENDPEITGVQSDSRLVEPGSLFVAVKGTAVDGHDYTGKAVEKGAVAVVCEHAVDVAAAAGAGGHAADAARRDIIFIIVPDSADALGRIASAWYGEPSSQMTVVGVTGTNGKTTVATLLYNLFRKLGYKAGLLSTVCNYIDGEVIPASHTTPDPLTINSLMAKMVDAGCEYAFMEVSSHAIDQKRISGLDFNGGIFTNLTRDHLDYHLTVENYLKAKKRFFDDLPASAFALTNADDKSGAVMLQNTPARKRTYSLRTVADFKGRIVESHFDGTEMYINGRDVYTHFIGRFNAYNLLAVYGAAVALGEDTEDILIALSTLRPVSGRFETICSPQGFTAIVDYAHTPDALENVLSGIREVLNGGGRVITVVGAGGNRDKGKRPLMAKEAARQSDLLILTSDNPRFEEPDDIINDMTAGLNAGDRERTICITDRKQAVKTAVTFAKKGDVILVAGKGHEDYQEIKGVKYHFDDKEIIHEIFKIDN
ncbi:MAG: UDP-N-acetylmuramoyl-L-alanyl-D-glutamate--2,6-diaminopimelate ligase [Tannerella sp.]|jgi:UDP-N-acetylmuramoyl-L-alanyl-D-glutamate--2,6-diaminopimelate ligase|nr:UDP-N-acetylmuramoyl-L-alanyl-D-glutamate--2,6-diaminopimelate ligase [Tannerella sp.]